MILKILEFAQYKQTYRYNSDSLILSDFALNCGVKNELLDVGAGCGIIGILLKSFIPNLSLNLLDIQEKNIDLIKHNLKQNHINAQVFHSDFRTFLSEKKFDFLVSNPPFYRDGAKMGTKEHENISKFQSFLPLDELISKANSLLKPRGVFYFAYEALALPKICAILENKKLKLTKIRFVYSTKNQKARLILIEARKGVKNSCEVLPPLLMQKNSNLSDEMQKICSRFRIKSYDI